MMWDRSFKVDRNENEEQEESQTQKEKKQQRKEQTEVVRGPSYFNRCSYKIRC
jgi:hypothetical protein